MIEQYQRHQNQRAYHAAASGHLSLHAAAAAGLPNLYSPPAVQSVPTSTGLPGVIPPLLHGHNALLNQFMTHQRHQPKSSDDVTTKPKLSSPLDLSTSKSPSQTDPEIEKTSDSDTRTTARNLSGREYYCKKEGNRFGNNMMN